MIGTVQRSVLATTVAVGVAAGAPMSPTSPSLEGVGPDPVPACSLSFFPDAVTPGRPDARVLAEATEQLSGTPTGSAAPGSGIEVRDVEPDLSPGAWVLALNLSEARPGRWRISLRGPSTECAGRLRIRG